MQQFPLLTAHLLDGTLSLTITEQGDFLAGIYGLQEPGNPRGHPPSSLACQIDSHARPAFDNLQEEAASNSPCSHVFPQLAGWMRQVIDVWTKQTPTNKTVTFKIEGDRKSGFVYSAKIEGRDTKEITGFLEELTREQVEVMFANYVTGM